jgi:hypothetical protein
MIRVKVPAGVLLVLNVMTPTTPTSTTAQTTALNDRRNDIDIDFERRQIYLPRTKNRDPRTFP